MRTLLIYLVAAFAEIAGCFAFWAWLRAGKSMVWTVAGTASLVLFALALSRAEADFAGRAFAAYGGVYIAAALLWLYGVEGIRPDRWDLFGAMLCLAGASVILFGPRDAPL